jgi:outer membrane protein assembly factor BamB
MTYSRLVSLLVVSGILSLEPQHWVGRAGGQEWTRFRGPNGSGHGTVVNLPNKWTEQDYNWKVKLPAGGHSSPVLWGERIFLSGADDERTADRVLFCIHAHDGRVLWTRKYSSTFHNKHHHNSFASSTAAVDEKHVYYCWSTPEEYTLLALDHEGREVWRRNLGPFVSQHSCGTSPIVYQNLVILGNDQDAQDKKDPTQIGKSFLVAVNRETGEIQWKVERNSDVVAYSTPCLYQPPGGKPELIFNSSAHGVTSLDPRDGRLNWEISALNDERLLTMRSVSSPVLAAGLLTISCGSGAGGNYLVAVRPGDTRAGKSPQAVYRIEQKDAAPYVPTPIAKGNLLFLFSDKGIVACLDAATGKKHWLERAGGNVFGSPVCSDERLFCVTTQGEVLVLAAKEKYELLGVNSLGEYSHATPALAGGRIYFRTYTHLISLGGIK